MIGYVKKAIIVERDMNMSRLLTDSLKEDHQYEIIAQINNLDELEKVMEEKVNPNYDGIYVSIIYSLNNSFDLDHKAILPPKNCPVLNWGIEKWASNICNNIETVVKEHEKHSIEYKNNNQISKGKILVITDINPTECSNGTEECKLSKYVYIENRKQNSEFMGDNEKRSVMKKFYKEDTI